MAPCGGHQKPEPNIKKGRFPCMKKVKVYYALSLILTALYAGIAIGISLIGANPTMTSKIVVGFLAFTAMVFVVAGFSRYNAIYDTTKGKEVK